MLEKKCQDSFTCIHGNSMSKCLSMTLSALGVNKARFRLVWLSHSLEGPIQRTLRSYCSTSYKSHGTGNESCYCQLIILYYFHRRERGSPQAGLAEIWQGLRGELEKPFILVCSSCCKHSKYYEEEPDQEQQPWNPVTFINLWLFLCGCSIASGYKLIFRAVQGKLSGQLQLLHSCLPKERKDKKKT